MESNKKKRRKHSYYDRLRYMHMLEEGYSFNYIKKHYGINDDLLKTLWDRYQHLGPAGLEKKKKNQSDSQLRKSVVLDIENNHLTLFQASLKYDVSTSAIQIWLKLARKNGLSALDVQKKRGRPKGMGRPRKNSSPLTEVEKLRKENQELKTQIALLKKVRALVEERNARLREIGHSPSKD